MSAVRFCPSAPVNVQWVKGVSHIHGCPFLCFVCESVWEKLFKSDNFIISANLLKIFLAYFQLVTSGEKFWDTVHGHPQSPCCASGAFDPVLRHDNLQAHVWVSCGEYKPSEISLGTGILALRYENDIQMINRNSRVVIRWSCTCKFEHLNSLQIHL